MKNKLIGLIAVAVIIFVVGYNVGYKAAPKEILDEEVTYVGPMTADTKKVLSATVESLKAQAHLVSYTYTGAATVNISRDKWIIFEGHQTLSLPVTVSYFVDLSLLKESDVSFSDTKNEVVVRLPKLMLTVAFQPERAIEINEGSLTLNDAMVQELRKLNYQTARKAVIKQAQQKEFVRLGSDAAIKNVTTLFTIPLRVAGRDDIQVQVLF